MWKRAVVIYDKKYLLIRCKTRATQTAFVKQRSESRREKEREKTEICWHTKPQVVISGQRQTTISGHTTTPWLQMSRVFQHAYKRVFSFEIDFPWRYTFSIWMFAWLWWLHRKVFNLIIKSTRVNLSRSISRKCLFWKIDHSFLEPGFEHR